MKRMIHSNLWVSEQVAKLSIPARLLYIGLITIADDDGRLKGSSLYLRGQIFPYDDKVTVSNVKEWLAEIINNKLVAFYNIDNEYYIYHPKWEKYQTLRQDRKRLSLIPPPDVNQVSTKCQPNDNQPRTEDKISKDKVSKDNRAVAPTETAEIVELINFFKDVNINYKEWFKNTTYRKDLQFLISEVGFDMVANAIKALPKINSTPYATGATTPRELKLRWSKIVNFVVQNKNIKNKSKIATV